jgi:hypothetical protein
MGAGLASEVVVEGSVVAAGALAGYVDVKGPNPIPAIFGIDKCDASDEMELPGINAGGNPENGEFNVPEFQKAREEGL